jgi:hypothetical protein
MSAITKMFSLVAISAALTLSGSHVFAKTGNSSHPSQVKTSGTSAVPSGAGRTQSKAKDCHYHHCVTVPQAGSTPGGGANPNRGGPDNPALHPK